MPMWRHSTNAEARRGSGLAIVKVGPPAGSRTPAGADTGEAIASRDLFIARRGSGAALPNDITLR